MQRGLKALLLSTLLVAAAACFAAATERHIILDGCRVECNWDCDEDSRAAIECRAILPNLCYQTYGECKRQPDGKCGWTPTLALATCIAHPPTIATP